MIRNFEQQVCDISSLLNHSNTNYILARDPSIENVKIIEYSHAEMDGAAKKSHRHRPAPSKICFWETIYSQIFQQISIITILFST